LEVAEADEVLEAVEVEDEDDEVDVVSVVSLFLGAAAEGVAPAPVEGTFQRSLGPREESFSTLRTAR
jgi:hypothetical protein